MKIALIGNPNCGKTTLFNSLTKSNARVGNWPGVTVEQKIGTYKRKNEEPIEVVDLPGIYSLSPYTSEEIVSRDFLIENEVDCVVNIVDSTNLERNLYLTTQLLEMDVNLIVALNFTDVVTKRGDRIDINLLQEKLNVPVCEISALKNKGIKTLIDLIRTTSKVKRKGISYISNENNISTLISNVTEKCQENKIVSPIFHATKFIENDEIEKKDHPFLEKDCSEEINKFKKDNNINNIEDYIANLRYEKIETNLSVCIKKAHRSAYSTSDKVDRILTNRFIGIPIFILIMFLIFQITFSTDFLFIGKMINNPNIIENVPSIGEYLKQLIEKLFELITAGIDKGLTNINSPLWLISLLNDGLINSIGAVISFLPQVLLLFLFIQILENSGYMSRVAFIFDKLLRKFGLSGRTLVPLISCFGCAVPGIMGTRTIESRKEKLLAIGLAPFFSCSAKLPIYLSVASAITANVIDPSIIALLMYFVGIVVAILVSLILSNTKYKNKNSVFIMELPSYHVPGFRSTSLAVLDELKKFLIRAGTLIAISSLVLWVLQSFDSSWNYVDSNIDESIISDIGKFCQPVFIPLGFANNPEGWKFVVASFTGLIAKEQVVASLELLSGGNIDLLLASVSASSLFSFMCFNLLTLPCVAAISAARSEVRNKKDFLFILSSWAIISYVVSMFVSSFGSLFEIRSNKPMSVLNIVCLTISLLMIICGIIVSLLIKYNVIKIKNKDEEYTSSCNDISSMCSSCSKNNNRRCH